MEEIDLQQLVFREEVRPGDIDIVRDIVESTGFFNDYEIPVSTELVEERLIKGDESIYYFLFADYKGKTLAYSCFGPIACTRSSYDLFWIVTHDEARGKGIGKVLLAKTEEKIKQMGGSLIVVETSSLEHYLPTRQYYVRCGYDKAAQIPDFYDEGDDKVIYIKKV
ncbi:MAG: GNAT family N-acetyltransferase [Bacteroidia bacterium]|nr:GNAT family N-acetyltransferase [Bacteroidia bacterium]